MRRIIYLLVLTAMWQPAEAETITVAQTGIADTQHIGDAVTRASAGDTIHVAAGTYYDIGLLIDKSLTLIGAGPDSTIFVYGWETSIGIVADHVTIEGFTFHYNTDGRAAVAHASGMIVVDHSPLIRGNRFTGAFAALELVGNARPTVQYNEFLTPVGIHLRDNSHDIDARFNAWDSEIRSEIEDKIVRQNSNGTIRLDGWLKRDNVYQRFQAEKGE